MAKAKKTIKNKPKKIEQITNENTVPYLEEYGKPIYPPTNRAHELSMKGEKMTDMSVGLEDINEAVMYYFKDVIRPYVMENGTKVNVPLEYANPERWKASQRDGMYRDKDGKMLLPVIVLNRTNIDKVRNIGNKLDGNTVNNYATFEKRYSKKNQYDNFAVVTNRIPVKELYNVVIPDYYKITYACSIYVNFIQDMDRIIEAIGQYSYSYWGREGKFKFMAMIESFPTRTEISQGSDRVIICNFDLTLNGYITPKDINAFLATRPKSLTKAQLIFTAEIQDSVEKFNIAMKQKRTQPSFNIFPEKVQLIGGGGGSLAVTSYLNTNILKKADIITVPNVAIFSNSALLQPPDGFGIPPTNVNSFNYFINGQFIPPSVITLVESGGNVQLTFNISQLGYLLETDDEIVAVGKWQS